jgi:C4-dicarboxylate-specific signal transduction histidine kinase
MNRISKFAAEKSRIALILAGAIALAAALAAAKAAHGWREAGRLSLLETAVARGGIEIMAQTLDGGIMGALTLLGLADKDIKRDVLRDGLPNEAPVVEKLEILGHAVGAQGVFVVGEDGLVRSSWDSSGKPSTGVDVRFRPYFRTALQGKENVYAAVSLARGDRALYFSAPVLAGNARGGAAQGALVARTELLAVDELLKERSDIALLLSPQGVVFAGSRPDWIGFLANQPTPERMRAIRELKQFGNMFESREPSVLPMDIDDGIHRFEGRRFAVASAKVQWNDPSGDWQLVMMEDLSRTVAWGNSIWVGGAAGWGVLLVLLLALNILRNQHARGIAAVRLEAYAKAQEASAEQKSRLAKAGIRFQQAATLGDLARAFLSESHDQLDALQGVIYVLEPGSDGVLSLAASYACISDLPPSLSLGQGILGECAIERRLRVIDTPEGGAWEIRSGLGNKRPEALVLVPVMLQETLLGVVELAFFHPPGERRLDLLKELTALFALNLEIQRRNRRTPDAGEAAVVHKEKNLECST